MRPFEGIRILDLTHVFAGPFCTFQLAVMGAEVIKIESPNAPDMMRDEGNFDDLNELGLTNFYICQNSEKKSLSLDLKVEKDKIFFLKLLETADVLVQNYSGNSIADLGLSYKKLKKINPRLIYCSMTGFGRTGPKSEHPAYDSVIQAYSGLMELNGLKSTGPLRVGPAVVDYGTGIHAAFAISSALYRRQITGKGLEIDVSMLDCQIAILENAIARYLAKNEIPKPMGSRHPSIAPFEAFKTKDTHIIIAAGNDKLFEKLCNLLKIPEISNDEKFSDNSSRSKNMDELKKILETKLSNKDTKEWVKVMEKEKIPCGPIFNIKEAVENPQVDARNMIVKAYHKVIGDFKLAGNPIKMSAYKDEKTRGDIPDLDEHRDKILKEFN